VRKGLIFEVIRYALRVSAAFALISSGAGAGNLARGVGDLLQGIYKPFPDLRTPVATINGGLLGITRG
jgi:hypothetical protein